MPVISTLPPTVTAGITRQAVQPTRAPMQVTKPTSSLVGKVTPGEKYTVLFPGGASANVQITNTSTCRRFGDFLSVESQGQGGAGLPPGAVAIVSMEPSTLLVKLSNGQPQDTSSWCAKPGTSIYKGLTSFSPPKDGLVSTTPTRQIPADVARVELTTNAAEQR
jgi:hypothetical protein